MKEQWDELKETIIELRDNDGTATQQEVCQFLANYMNVLEAQMELMKEKSLDEITKAHEQIGYERGYRDGYAQAVGVVEVVERKKGRWVKQNPFVDTEECSLCKYNIYSEELETPFCPWCGAEMEGNKNEKTN